MKIGYTYAAILAAAVLGLMCTGVSFAQHGEEQSKPYKGKAEKVLSQLNLSPQQEAQIKELHKGNRQRAKELRQALREKRKALEEELDKPNSDLAKIKALTAELKDMEGRVTEDRVNGVLKMKEILTPEQYLAFSNAVKKMHNGDNDKRRRQQ